MAVLLLCTWAGLFRVRLGPTILDKNFANGANMHRLLMTDLTGTITYSQVVTIM
jgi:hypothetical protein